MPEGPRRVESHPSFKAAGDRALALSFGEAIDETLNAKVVALEASLRENPMAGVLERVPSYRALLVYYDPDRISFSRLKRQLIQRIAAIEAGKAASGRMEAPSRCHEIPVCYGASHGPDLPEVARHCGLSEAEVIQLHSSIDYRIYMLGFLPGFAYLGGMDPKLATPRLAEPRAAIPAGSVGIAGGQTGIYPLASPGGWQLIGATPLKVYDPRRPDPILYRAGDRIRFRPIDEEEFQALARKEAGFSAGEDKAEGKASAAAVTDRLGKHESSLGTQGRSLDNRESSLGSNGRSLGKKISTLGKQQEGSPKRGLTVLNPGLLCTVQDGGRFGYQSLGIAASGALDSRSLAIANLLVGNKPEEAALELCLFGPDLVVECGTIFAIAGARMGAKLNGKAIKNGQAFAVQQGDRLSFGAAVSGCRAYLAVAGGFQLPEVLGSKSTNMRCALGGFEGRALKAGDQLGFADPLAPLDPPPWRGCPEEVFPDSEICLRVIPGPQEEYFSAEGLKTFYEASYILGERSDRMGCILEDPAVQSLATTDIVSDGIAPGSVQITSSGKPIVMLADRQTTGGYAKIATVIGADLRLLAQRRPGQSLRFRAVSLAQARKAARAESKALARLAESLKKNTANWRGRP